MNNFHGQIRQQQRGTNDEVIRLIESFGVAAPGKGDSHLLELPRSFMQLVTKAMKSRLILNEGRLITPEFKIIRTQKRMKSENQPRPSKPRQDRVNFND